MMEEELESQEEIEVIYLSDESDEDISEFGDSVPDVNELQEEIVDLSKVTFNKHENSVFSSSLSKDGKIAVTGGQDDMAYIWNTETAEVICECTGHKDSVTEVSFNYDNQYVVTGDMAGLIQVWKVSEKKLVWCYEVDDIEWLLWHPLSNVIFCGTKSGDIYLWQIPSSVCKILPSHGSSSTCAKILPDGKRLLVGYSDGKIKLWDIKSISAEWQLSDNIESAINHMCLINEGTVCAISPTGHLIKVEDGQILGSILLPDEKDVETIEFNNKLGLLAAGSLSGRICLWDMKKSTLRHETKINSSVTSMKWTVFDNLLIGTAEGDVHICDGKQGTLIRTLSGHRDSILSLCVSDDGSKVLTTSDDGTAKIFIIQNDT